MAQLRDAQTSELILEGTPYEVAAAAAELGLGEVLFDGVGAGFEPSAPVESHEQELEALEGLEGEDVAERVTGLERAAARVPELVEEAQARMDEARARVED
jgi:hypothetical protein